MLLGILCAAVTGLGYPMNFIISGYLVESFASSGERINGKLTHLSVYNKGKSIIRIFNCWLCTFIVILGFCVVIFSMFQIWTFVVSAQRQIRRIQQMFFNAVLHQEMAWFDSYPTGTLNNRVTQDMNTIHEGICDKLCITVQVFSTCFSGIISAFLFGWKLTLVILSITPLISLTVVLWTKLVASLTTKEIKAYAKAGAVAEEIFTSIRTVAAFNGQQKAMDKYDTNLIDAKNFGIKKSITSNMPIGFAQLLIFSSFAMAFWYGTRLTMQEPENYTVRNVVTICLSVLVSVFTMGRGLTNIESITKARAAAFEIFNIINKPRPLDSGSTDGYKPDKLIGNIEFKNVHFAYPSRPDTQILTGLNLKVSAGKTLALVGTSGCGKSTTIQLLQRFYEATEGEITLDGHEIRSLNIKWLRDNIGVVSQEPVLFGTTIRENIRLGRDGATDEEIEQAAKEANAYDFILRLPDQFNTMVGERGAQLSGGQKQRIAIARALVQDPKILLLDETMSALDIQNEAIVQAAFDKASAGRTIIIVAHRLSSIRTADMIAVLQDGVVVELGTHSELMEKKGTYHSFVRLQEQGNGEEDQRADNLFDSEYSGEVRDMGETQDGEDNWPTLQDVEKMLDPIKSESFQKGSIRRESKEELSEITKKEDGGAADEEQDEGSFAPIRRILLLSKPEWIYIGIGMIAAAIIGGLYSTFALFYSKIMGAFHEQDLIKRVQKTDSLALILLVVGLFTCIAYFITGFLFGKSEENLTMRLRSLSFKAMLRQDMAYFDDHKNAVGVLLTRLATDTSQVKEVVGRQLESLMMVLFTLITALIIAFVHGWQLTLFVLACVPLLIGAIVLKQKSMACLTSKDQKALEEAGKLMTEVVENIKTVASLAREDVFYEQYNASLSGPYRNVLKKAPIYGVTYGIAQSFPFFMNAMMNRFAAWLIAHSYTTFEDAFVVILTIINSIVTVGYSSSFAIDFGKTKLIAQRIFQLLDRKPTIDIYSEEGVTLDQMEGNLEFKNIQFVYPTRPNAQILQGLSIKVSKGQTLALVGSSGSGKSTLIQLLERFYDPAEGQVLTDGIDVKSLHLKWLRSQFGIVSQEPILFDCSIKENIQYGDNNRSVPLEEVIEAAKEANIHTFIISLPQGYNTCVGNKGTQLSGGQKQRIAIARALVRKPKVLLLDEATSALDSESEKTVQEALDNARQGRTCVVITHRLSTIQNADIIAVIKNGKVVEHGTHSQLLASQAEYFAIVNSQV
ncbi:Multidrug resistance protein, partial [Pristimantis euphronides]